MAKAKIKKFKMKTYKAAAKRFRVTKNGKIVRMKGGKSHLRRKKSSRTKYKLRKDVKVLSAGERKRVMRLVPYLKKFR